MLRFRQPAAGQIGSPARMGFEDPRQHLPVATGNVNDVADAGKVIGFGGSGPGDRRPPAHGVIENARRIGMFLEIGETAIQAIQKLEAVPARPDAVSEADDRLPEGPAAVHEHEGAHRISRVGAQAVSHWR